VIEKARQWLRDARRVAALTGAGISAESGIPTFRGAGGLWREFRAEDLATSEAFARDPRLLWEWYDWRRGLIAKAQPNAGHRSLAELERRCEFTLITQNVDGLHDRAGNRSPIKIHGDIWDLRCTKCARAWRDERTPLPELPPRCACGALARPGVVWFGEGLPRGAWEAACRAAGNCEVFLVIGTSAVVYPAAGLVPLARDAGAKVIEVNLEPTAATTLAHAALHGKAAEILPPLLAPAR
jgi:NAD-dependent deacetylase